LSVVFYLVRSHRQYFFSHEALAKLPDNTEGRLAQSAGALGLYEIVEWHVPDV